jgi:hypothetical protein
VNYNARKEYIAILNFQIIKREISYYMSSDIDIVSDNLLFYGIKTVNSVYNTKCIMYNIY